jgi:MFS family permease
MIADRITRGSVIVITAVLGVMVSFGSLVVFSFGVFMKPLSRQFGWSRSEISLGFTVTALMIAVFSPLIGRIVDRIGARRVLLPCTAVYGVAFCCLALLRTLPEFYAIYLAIGMVGIGTTQLCYGRVISAWFDRRRGIALAAMMTGVGAGAIGIPPLATWLIDSFGWRPAYLILGGAIFLFSIIPTALFLRETPPGAPQERPALARLKLPGLNAGDAFRTPTFWMLVTGFFLFSMSVNGCIAHLVPMLTDRGIGNQGAALALSILGVLTLCGRLLTGVLLDRFHGPRVTVVFFSIAAAGVAVISQAHQLAIAYTGAALIGLGMGAEMDVMLYLISRYFGLRSFSEIYGYALTGYAVAGALGPLFMGWSYDQLHSYTVVTVIFAAVMFAGALVLGLLPAYPQLETKEPVAAAVAPAI